MAAVRNIVLCYCVVVLVAWLGVNASSTHGSKSIIGGNCSVSNCTDILGAECVNQTCVCSNKYVPSSNKTTCLPIQSNIGDKCQEDAQCNSTNRMCGKNHTCTQIVGTVGERCSANTTCFLQNGGDKYVSCTNGTCSCNSGYKPAKDNKSCEKSGSNTGSLPLLCVSTAVFALVAKMLS
ncbi:coagulation factor IX [Anabrus simplex]|uniref:coagulation factor IX n=1 Tax=Anabrus simplex TaxID=316456 RepID=UPI0035A3B7B6